MTRADDSSVPSDLKLYRRISPEYHLVRDENADAACCRISSGAFRHEGLSVLLHDTLAESGREPHQVVTGAEPYLVSVTAEQMRDAGQVVCREPNEEDCAHGEVVGSKGSRSRKKKLLRAAVWEVRPDSGCEPPCGSLAKKAA
jgi:hypothetical protein